MKTVLITGAGGGMGSALCDLLSLQGYRVFALDRREIQAGERIIPVRADITDEQSVKAAFDQVSAHTDRLDAIVHFAGIYMLDSLVEIERAAFCRMFDVNVQGVYLINKTFMPLLSRGSRIVITTSELAPLDPLPFTGLYAVTKAALDRYAYSLRMELQLLGIGVAVLRAGAVQTDMLGVSTAALDRFCEHTALYRCNAARFKRIVEGVEARCVPPAAIANKCARMLGRRRLPFAHHINRNPLLLLLNVLPRRMQLWIIRCVLHTGKEEKAS